MKNLFTTIFVAIFLAGCSLFPQEYDNNEYELLARLETSVVLINENCDDNSIVSSYIPELEYNARLLHTYAFYTPRNTEVYEIANILKEDVMEFKKQYEIGKASKFYCTAKSNLFLKKVRTALEAVAKKSR
jgi:hypothetical protein